MDTLKIIKIGGKIIDNPSLLNACLQSFSDLSDKKILVHGGGKAGSRMLEALDIPVSYHEGRRITDKSTLDVVTMVYAGIINKSLVAALQATGCNAIGFSGCDGNIITAAKRVVRDVDYGYAGDITHINTQLLHKIIDQGMVPVINPITHDKKGQLLNTNADTITSTLGEALTKDFQVHLHYCFELNGVLKMVEDPNSVIPWIDEITFKKMVKENSIASGMIPKLFNAFNGLKNGVASITIGNHNHFTGNVPHTKITL